MKMITRMQSDWLKISGQTTLVSMRMVEELSREEQEMGRVDSVLS